MTNLEAVRVRFARNEGLPFADVLTEANILERREYKEPDQRGRTEYRLTDKGRDLFPAILALSQWSERWMPPPEGPVARVLSRKSGRPVAVVMTSDSKVESLAMRDVEITPGPGAKRLDRPRHRQQR